MTAPTACERVGLWIGRRSRGRLLYLCTSASSSHQGCGLATEALGRVLEYVFDQLGKHRVFAVTDAENEAAASLMRRVGLRQEVHYVEHVWFKGAWASEYLFALLRREWQARRTRGNLVPT